jgi:dipeptidyl-peptidase III
MTSYVVVTEYVVQGHGDQKFTPGVTKEFLERVSSISSVATELYRQLADSILVEQPSSLGFPSNVAQSSYYPGDLRISREEIAAVSKTLKENSIYPENTRIHKTILKDKVVFDVLQGSAIVDCEFRELQGPNSIVIRVIRGDHSRELNLICNCLEAARKYTANSRQEKIISDYQDSFRSGVTEIYKQAQKSWVQDLKPTVETILGFIEPYRDPFGVRAEFEGVVAVVDSEETKVLASLVLESTKFIRRLPWAQGTHENNGKGPFERDLFEPPDFTSVHVGRPLRFIQMELFLLTLNLVLAYCSSIIFLDINLPNVSTGE